MHADDDRDPLDRWLSQQVQPLPPPPGTFELISRRARRRKLRKLAVTVVSAAAVAAAVAVAVPVGLNLHLSQPPVTGRNVAAGASMNTAKPSTNGSATPIQPSRSPSSTPTEGSNTPGYLPPNFAPFSVTWDSPDNGWIIGPAGSAGHCGAEQNSAICTSVARTTDGGLTWSGLPAPVAAGPDKATGVSGIRFADDVHGWAFGPDLWATGNGGENWHQVPTGNAVVTDLETVNGRAWALFADCSNVAGANTIANCHSFTLMTTTVGSDTWTPVAGVPANLTSAKGLASAVIELSNTEAYLVAPDGMLYSGPVNGGSGHSVRALPGPPLTALPDGLPQGAMLAPAGTMASGVTRLALVCSTPEGTRGYATVAYLSDNDGADWTALPSVGISGTASSGQSQSLTATSGGTLLLATTSGIYRLPLGAAQWQQAGLTGSQAPENGFSYVGMTTSTQGVALASPNQTQIWMTSDGGLTWQERPIKSG